MDIRQFFPTKRARPGGETEHEAAQPPPKARAGTLDNHRPPHGVAHATRCTQQSAGARKRKRCACGKAQPSFGPQGGAPKDARWCARCPEKPEDAVDVVSKRCACGRTQPCLGPEGGAPKDARWCARCPEKPADAVDVVSKRCACGRARPCLGPQGGTPKDARWCARCPEKPEDAVDVVHLNYMCPTEHCDIRGNKHLEGYCMACFRFKYPEHPRVRHARSEELAVFADVYRRFSTEVWAQRMVSDRRIDGGCSQRRPDMFVDLLTHVLIVEVDERQHRDYETSCEHKRIMEIFQDAGSRPLVVLRFNPHGYTDATGARVRSPWTRDPKTNEPRVPPNRRGEWTAKLNALATRINHWTALRDIPEREVHTEWLFYDGSA
jgi:hypothetical protein